MNSNLTRAGLAAAYLSTIVAATQVHNTVGEPVRLLCPCGREWRCLPVEWAVQVTTVAGLERVGDRP